MLSACKAGYGNVDPFSLFLFSLLKDKLIRSASLNSAVWQPAKGNIESQQALNSSFGEHIKDPPTFEIQRKPFPVLACEHLKGHVSNNIHNRHKNSLQLKRWVYFVFQKFCITVFDAC